ncbi:hypothetical protein [Thalassobacillus sp. CUG 92003]|uniref:hypothetical protein n=1 Tax=Thalassobacillus sp. CUG 92003 TaxID=2736641 RepID=UPI0015E721D5|nr:hypothetical protein [Thalassobacillus sp. CUG 92003]
MPDPGVLLFLMMKGDLYATNLESDRLPHVCERHKVISMQLDRIYKQLRSYYLRNIVSPPRIAMALLDPGVQLFLAHEW